LSHYGHEYWKETCLDPTIDYDLSSVKLANW